MIISKRNTYLIRLFVYFMLFIISYLVVATFSDTRVRRNASQFCGQLLEGEASAHLSAAAIEAGATVSEPSAAVDPETTARLIAKFHGLAPFDGYACDIQIKNDRAIAWTLSELDP
jgi:hypothetical protein